MSMSQEDITSFSHTIGRWGEEGEREREGGREGEEGEGGERKESPPTLIAYCRGKEKSELKKTHTCAHTYSIERTHRHELKYRKREERDDLNVKECVSGRERFRRNGNAETFLDLVREPPQRKRVRT